MGVSKNRGVEGLGRYGHSRFNGLLTLLTEPTHIHSDRTYREHGSYIIINNRQLVNNKTHATIMKK